MLVVLETVFVVFAQSEAWKWFLASVASNGSVHQRDMTAQIVEIVNGIVPNVSQNTDSQQVFFKV